MRGGVRGRRLGEWAVLAYVAVVWFCVDCCGATIPSIVRIRVDAIMTGFLVYSGVFIASFGYFLVRGRKVPAECTGSPSLRFPSRAGGANATGARGRPTKDRAAHAASRQHQAALSRHLVLGHVHLLRGLEGEMRQTARWCSHFDPSAHRTARGRRSVRADRKHETCLASACGALCLWVEHRPKRGGSGSFDNPPQTTP